MQRYRYEIVLEATNETEAEAKMKALVTLASRLKVKELEKLAWIVKNDPVKTALAKKALGV